MAGSSERKTVVTDVDVDAFLDALPDAQRADDAREVVDLLRRVTGTEPRMWGSSMVGFGTSRYRTSDGKEHETFAVGLAPRKAALTLYGMTFYGTNADLLERLGPHTTGKGCLYLKRLDAVDRDVLEELAARAWQENATDPG